MKYTVIKSKEQYYNYCDILKELAFSERKEHVQDEIELLTLLIEGWDDRNRLIPKLGPVELLKSLIDDHHLNQTELADIAGVGKSYMSEILHYKKKMSKKIIRNIADHFKIRQEVLNRPYSLKGDDKEKVSALNS